MAIEQIERLEALNKKMLEEYKRQKLKYETLMMDEMEKSIESGDLADAYLYRILLEYMSNNIK